MSKDYKAEIDIFIKTLEESVNIFNIISIVFSSYKFYIT